MKYGKMQQSNYRKGGYTFMASLAANHFWYPRAYNR